MIDSESIARAVNEHIAKSVNEQVIATLADPKWLEKVERQLVMYCQNRLAGKFSNLESMPEIQDLIKESITDFFDQGKIPGIHKFISNEKIQQAVDQAVETQLFEVLDTIGNDPAWSRKINAAIQSGITEHIKRMIQNIDAKTLVRNTIVENLRHYQDIFSLKGVQANAKATELTVMDQAVVVENELITRSMSVVDTAKTKNLIIEGDLAVLGSINTDNHSWQNLSEDIAVKTMEKVSQRFLDGVKNAVLEQARTGGIDFTEVSIAGEKLINNDRLSGNVTRSSLVELGNLEKLKVAGETSLNETLSVKRRRVGINTDNPDDALTVWDDEVCIVAGKRRADTAFVGTLKPQNLEIGVNRQPAITVDRDGVTTIKKARIGINSISWANEPPGYAGTKGDIVFNQDFRAGRAFAWVCIGQYNWQEVKPV